MYYHVYDYIKIWLYQKATIQFQDFKTSMSVADTWYTSTSIWAINCKGLSTD